jgi:putative restriction endonuclease
LPALSNASLFRRLRAALPAGTAFQTAENATHPAEFSVPGFGNVRAYLFTVTRDRSTAGRPPGEFKIQLIIEGQARGTRAGLDHADAYTVLLGFSPDFGVFVGWESRLYTRFAYSANVQVREPLLIEGRDTGWAVASPRALRQSEEVRVAFAPSNLTTFLRASREADRQDLIGIAREAFLLSRAPNYQARQIPNQTRDLERYVQRERQRLNSSRLSRDSKFAPRVKEQFGYACCVCGIQLEIVEAAHIIPVNDARSSDDIWNGLSLCPNHHTLFDAHRFIVLPTLRIAVDNEAIAFLRESGRASGIEILSDFEGEAIRRPQAWLSSEDLRERMRDALGYIRDLTGFA